MLALGVVDAVELIAHLPLRVGPKSRTPGLGGAELQIAPALGAVHVDHPLRRPDPVVLGPALDLLVFAVDDFQVPFHAQDLMRH